MFRYFWLKIFADLQSRPLYDAVNSACKPPASPDLKSSFTALGPNLKSSFTALGPNLKSSFPPLGSDGTSVLWTRTRSSGSTRTKTI
jgi:hypothetical protein